MQITLTEDEIKVALEDYIAKQGIGLDDVKTEINLSAGRGPNGFSAEISLLAKGAVKKKTAPKKVAVKALPSSTDKAVSEEEATTEVAKDEVEPAAKKSLVQEVADAPEETNGKAEESTSLFS